MICGKCGRVVRPGNTRGRDETLTERRYYCSCGFVSKTHEQIVVVWKKTVYTPRASKAGVMAERAALADRDAEQVPQRKRRGRKAKA
jgi:hypothetical protein